MKKISNKSLEKFFKIGINSLKSNDTEFLSKFNCNNGCYDCISKKSGEDIFSLNEDRLKGEKILLEGVEATINKKFWSIAKYLSQVSSEFILVTNGRVFSYDHWTNKIASIEPNRIIVKMFGCNENEHDEHTQISGSYNQTIQGIRNLRSKGLTVRIVFYVEKILDKKYSSLTEIQEYINLSYSLTNTLPIQFNSIGNNRCEIETIVTKKTQEGEQEIVHPGKYRYDMLTYLGDEVPHAWRNSHFPMIHILTGPACNIKCIYCNVHGGDKQTQFVYEFDYVKKMIDDAIKRGLHLQKGLPILDLIGGEPTLHPNLGQLILYAKRSGFKYVAICTNGIKLAKKSYLNELLETGLDAIRFSFHSHLEEEAATLAHAPSTGKKYLSTANLLLEQKRIVTYFYRILLSTTVESFPQYVEWLIDNNNTGRKIYLNVGMPSPRGRMFINSHLYPNLEICREVVTQVVNKYSSQELEITLHHSPGCLIPNRPELSATNNLEARQYEIGLDKPVILNFEGDTQYTENCKKCISYHKCPGVPHYYLSQDQNAVEKWVRPQS